MLQTISDVLDLEEEPVDDALQLPELPTWLAEIDQHYKREGPACLDALNGQENELFTLLMRARVACPDSACQLGEHFETGAVPGGASLEDAMKWYEFAARIGSAKAAYRMAQLQAWKDRRNPLAGLDMTLLALQNMHREGKLFNWRSVEGWSLAAQIILFALEKGMVDDGNEALDKLMRMEGFKLHPDFERIEKSIRKLSRKYESDLSLVVVSSKISDDSDFKVGLYRKLEKPLPLVRIPLNVGLVQTTLDREFPWFARINALVCRQLAAMQFSRTPAFRIRPLLLAGLPGVGKTTWVKRLAELCGVPFRSVMAAGNSDSMYLRGTPRGWSSARPGAVLQAMVTEGVANPLFMIDELEKASPDNRNGRLWDVLLQMLEPSSARTYLDECLQVPSDLSWVSWIATANELGALPKPLLERFTIVMADTPGEDHFLTLVHGAVASYAKELGIDQRMLPALSVEDMEVLRQCKSPREINRTVTLIMEEGLTRPRNGMVH